MHSRTWKKFEGRVAAMFGSQRAVLSGSANREDKGCSDSTHPTLFIESKHRESHAIRTLYNKTWQFAAKEGKRPVVALGDMGQPGFLLVVHSGFWEDVIAEYIASQTDEDRDRIEGLIRTAYNRRREGGEAVSACSRRGRTPKGIPGHDFAQDVQVPDDEIGENSRGECY